MEEKCTRGPRAAYAPDEQARAYNNSFFDASPLNGWLRCEVSERFPIRYVNPYMARLLGFDSGEELLEFCGGSFAGLMYTEDGLREIFDRAVALPVQGNLLLTYRLRTKSGGEVWVRDCSHKYIAEDGTPMLLCLCVDITDQRRTEKALARASGELSRERQYQELLDASLPVGTVLVALDRAGTLLHVGGTMLAELGYTREEYEALQKRHLRGLVLEEDYGKLFTDRRGRKGPHAQSFEQEFRVVKKDGGIRWMYEKGTLVTVNGGPAYIIVCMDVTRRKEAEEQLRIVQEENERVFRMVAAHSNRKIYRYDIAKGIVYADEGETGGMVALADNMPESVIERGIVLPESIDDVRQAFAEIRAGKPEGGAKVHVRLNGGAPRWMDLQYSLVHAGNHAPTFAVLSLRDITEEHERELAYARYRQTVGEGVDDGSVLYFETDLTSDTVEKQGGNIPALAFPESGCRHEDAVRFGIENLVASEWRTGAWAFFSREHLITAFSDGTHSLSMDLPVHFPVGKQSWFRADVQMIRDPYSDHIKAYTILRDVTEEKLAALDVKKQAETDGMTGLYNKSTTEALVRARLADAGNRPCALLIVDLDSLKSINDNLGHAQGDRAIRFMAEAIRSQFRHTDIVGRIGGDEFLAFLDGVGDEARLNSMLTALMRKLSTRHIGENNDVDLRGSIGVAFGFTGADSFEALYRRADTALYHVKRNGKNDYAFYTPEMEGTTYRYQGHSEASLWQADAFDHAELDRLLYAVSAVYPLVISVNLTQNSYYMMQYNHFTTAACADAGEFDKLIADGTETFHPDDRQAFYAAFNRESLLAAYARGEKTVRYTGRQLGDDKIYRRICTDVIFTQNTPQGDVTQITLAREV